MDVSRLRGEAAAGGSDVCGSFSLRRREPEYQQGLSVHLPSRDEWCFSPGLRKRS